MNTTHQEFLQVQKLFLEDGLSLKGLLDDHLYFSKMTKSKIVDDLEKRVLDYSDGNDVNLICHSMGCNFGALIGRHPSVKKIVFISPEFVSSSRKERSFIKSNTSQKYADEIPMVMDPKPISERLLLVGLFLRSRRWALQELYNIEIPVMVVYSEGDPFVFREFSWSNAKEVMVETSYHNPFMSKEGKQLVKKIRDFL